MTSSEKNNDTIKLLAKIYTWRKPLLIVSAVAFIISTAISLLIAPQYKSTAVVFPLRTFSVSKLLIEQNQGSQEDYMDIGDEDDAEKLLQILNSSEIRLNVANKFNLWDNWRIDKSDKKATYFLKQKWDDMVDFKRTIFLSIKIEVYDYQAYRAAEIANAIVSYADSVKYKMTKTVGKQALIIVKQEYDNTMLRMREIEDSMQVIRELGVLDYKSEIEAYSKSMAKAIEKGNENAKINLQVKLNLLKKYGLSYESLQANLKKYRFKYPVIKGKYDEALVNATKGMPASFVVEKATTNEKKERPMCWLIVLISTVSTFTFALICLLMRDKFEVVKKKIMFELQHQNTL